MIIELRSVFDFLIRRIPVGMESGLRNLRQANILIITSKLPNGILEGRFMFDGISIAISI